MENDEWDDFDFSNINCDISISQLDRLPAQDLIALPVPAVSRRYDSVKPYTSEELNTLKQIRLPINTKRQNSWAMKTFENWANWRNLQPQTILEGLVQADLSVETCSNINFWMSRFIVECRRQDGSLYPPNTLYQIVTGIQRWFKEQKGRNEINFFETTDPTFAEFRKQLDANMIALTNDGIGIHRQRADPITDDDETTLWDTGVIGFDSAKALSNGVFFYNCKVFGFRGFRGGYEH